MTGKMTSGGRADSIPPMARRRLIHPLDGLVLVLAIGLAVVAYAYLFRRTPVPRPVDPLLGAEVLLEIRVDRPWKAAFPGDADRVTIEEYLATDVVSGPAPVEGRDDAVRLRLRIRSRDAQQPEALTLFRTGIRRGSILRLSTLDAEVRAEVIEVESPEPEP